MKIAAVNADFLAKSRTVCAIVEFDPWPFAENTVALNPDIPLARSGWKGVRLRGADMGWDLMQGAFRWLARLDDGSVIVCDDSIEIGDRLVGP